MALVSDSVGFSASSAEPHPQNDIANTEQIAAHFAEAATLFEQGHTADEDLATDLCANQIGSGCHWSATSVPSIPHQIVITR